MGPLWNGLINFLSRFTCSFLFKFCEKVEEPCNFIPVKIWQDMHFLAKSEKSSLYWIAKCMEVGSEQLNTPVMWNRSVFSFSLLFSSFIGQICTECLQYVMHTLLLLFWRCYNLRITELLLVFTVSNWQLRN
jgi:hypothetical protein